MQNFLQFLIKNQHLRDRSPDKGSDGFTMIELLVGAIMAFLIITPLLGFVVSILNDDRREEIKANAEYELQAAVDFISEDLSQAFYIYDKEDGDEKEDKRVDEGVGPLPDRGTPILVFWKRHRLPDSYPPISNNGEPSINPIDCESEEDDCDDTYVNALVAYYLIDGDRDRTWCQPYGNGDNCPKRIVRYLIYDGLKNRYGLDYQDGQLKDTQQREDGYNQNFDLSLLLKKDDPLAEEQAKKNVTTGEFPAPQVLVNYIDEFTLDEVGNHQVVKFTIRSNALRRIDAFVDECPDEETSFCPKASVRVEGLEIR